MNSWHGIGNLGRDVDLRYTPEQTAVARFSIAISRINKDETDWINCVAFGRTAENIERFCHKGSQIGITGRIQTGSYIDKDNKKRYTTDVIVERFDLLGKSGEKKENTETNFATQDEDVPF